MCDFVPRRSLSVMAFLTHRIMTHFFDCFVPEDFRVTLATVESLVGDDGFALVEQLEGAPFVRAVGERLIEGPFSASVKLAMSVLTSPFCLPSVLF